MDAVIAEIERGCQHAGFELPDGKPEDPGT